MRHLRWLSFVAPVVAVAVNELVSDGLLDETFPFLLDTLVVVVVVAVLAWIFTGVAFSRIDRLSSELRARNADLERREGSARALHRVSVAVAALPDLDEILALIVGQARDLLRADVAVLLLTGPDGIGRLTATSGPEDAFDRAGGFPGSEATRFVRPDLAIARLEAPLHAPVRPSGSCWSVRDTSTDSRRMRSRRSHRLPTRQPSPQRTPGSRRACASSPWWPSESGSPARCTTASPRSSVT